MPRADETDAPRTDPNPGTVSSGDAERTPSAVGAQISTSRPTGPASATPASDTLLSAPQATRADLALDERLASVERTLDELSRKVADLSAHRPEGASAGPQMRWFWLVFLAGLALAWQILAHLR